MLATLLGCGKSSVDLFVVNNTGQDGLSVAIDGKVVVSDIPHAATETPAAGRLLPLPLGAHRIEARDAGGAVIATHDVDVKKGTRYLFAPAHQPTTCFALVSDGYGYEEHSVEWFEPKPDLHAISDRMIDRWLLPNPPAVEVQKNTKSTRERSVRMAPCPKNVIPALP